MDNNKIIVQYIEVIYKDLEQIRRNDYPVKFYLKNEFQLGKMYLENSASSFYIKKVRTLTKDYEFDSNNKKLRIIDKKLDCNIWISAEEFTFKASKNCQILFPKSISNNKRILIGLQDIKHKYNKILDIKRNQLICVSGPIGCGKSLLVKELVESKPTKKFIWVDYWKLCKNEELYFSQLRNITTKEKDLVICIKDFERLQKNFVQINSFLENVLKHNEFQIKILITMENFSFLKPDSLIDYSHNILVRNLNKDEKFALLKYLIEKVTGRTEFEDGMYEFAGNFNGFTALDIEFFVYRVASEYPLLTLQNLRTCRKSIDFIPDRLQKLVAHVELINWSDIGGYEEVKEKLRLEIQIPLFKGKKVVKGVLLHGPPGCSKTMFARALATECGIHLFSIRPSTVLRGLVGESEQLLSQILGQAKASAPSIVFIDEIDTLFPNREGLKDSPVTKRLLNELMTFLDGIESKFSNQVIFMAATNFVNKLDEALIRKGRIDLHIKIDLPDKLARESILKIIVSDLVFSVDREVIENIPNIAEQLHGKSGAEIVDFGRKLKKLARLSSDNRNVITLNLVYKVLNNEDKSKVVKDELNDQESRESILKKLLTYSDVPVDEKVRQNINNISKSFEGKHGVDIVNFYRRLRSISLDDASKTYSWYGIITMDLVTLLVQKMVTRD